MTSSQETEWWQRFWSKVEPDPGLGSCWHWRGWKSYEGYGMCRLARNVTLRAHRVTYERIVGPVPNGLPLDHLCRQRDCVNPAHLEPVTHRVNILRGESRSAQRARQKTCSRGHPLIAENLYSEPGRTHRICRICKNWRTRKYRELRREASP